MPDPDEVANQRRAIQGPQDQKDAGSQQNREAVQTGPAGPPAPSLQQPHLRKPGQESGMELKPQFMARHYKGSGKPHGQVAIVTGGVGE